MKRLFAAVQQFVTGAAGRVGRVVAWWQSTRAGRALTRFGVLNGGLITGGLAYSALFSLFAALALGYTALATVASHSPGFQQTVLQGIDNVLPGLIDTGNGGVLSPEQLFLGNGLSLTALVAAGALVWSVISFMGALRGAVRSMLGTAQVPQSPLVAMAIDAGAVVVVMLGVALTSVASVGANAAAGWLAQTWHISVPGLVTLAGLALAAVVDAGIVAYLIVVQGRFRPTRRRDLAVVLAGAAIAFGALRWAGTGVVTGSATSNPLLAPFAVVVTVLILVNLVARLLLMACAWLADPRPSAT